MHVGRTKSCWMRRGCSLLMTAALFLTPIYSDAEEAVEQNASVEAVVELEETVELSVEEPVEEYNMPFALGNNGYYIINGANMVAVDDTVFYGLEDGIHMKTAEEEILLCEDVAANLNYGNDKLYYSTAYEGGTYIKVIDIAEMTYGKSFQLSGVTVKHMYLVSERYLLFSAEGSIFSLDLVAEEVSPYGFYEDVFSFIPTEYGIFYAKGSLFDYDIYADENLIAEHAEGYYVDGALLVYKKDFDEHRLEAAMLFDDGLREEQIETAYREENCFESITVAEFMAELSEVVPAELEEKNVLETAEIGEALPEEQVVLDMDGFVTDTFEDHARADSGVLIDAKVNEGQAKVAAKAHEIYNDVWVTKGKVRKWGSATSGNMIAAGTEVHGIIYTQAVNNGKFVLDPNGMSWEEYKEERENPDSKLYSESINDWSWCTDGKGVKKYGPKYGSDCSTFASYCWGLASRKTTAGLAVFGVKKNNAGDFCDLQVGDIINEENNHVIIITGIKYQENGTIRWIETTEQKGSGTTQTTFDSLGQLEAEYPAYTLYRCPYISDNAQLTLSEQSHSLYVKDSFQLQAEGSPGGKITWKSSNTSIAKVDKNGLVTAVKAGTATITATLTSDGASPLEAECVVTVLAKTITVDIPKTVYVGYPESISAKAEPDAVITWKSANTSIATVSNGMLVGKKAGNVKISAKANGVTETRTVTVKSCKLFLSSTNLSLHMGETRKLTATSQPAQATVTWSSSNTAVVSVDGAGNITALKKGTATVTAKSSNGKTAKCRVTVKNPTVKLDNTKLTVYIGAAYSQKLTATPIPAPATVTWSSSNTSIATVKDGVVTGLKKGTVTITAKANGTKATCKVTVKQPTFTLNSTLSVYRGETKNIKATPTPDTAIIWKSDNPAIAKVDKNGAVTGVAAGKTKITATAHGITKTCTVTVKKPTFTMSSSLTVYQGSTGKITATPTPSTTISWRSENPAIVRVNNKGAVTGLAVGKTKVIATAHGITKSCTVTVKKPTFTMSKSLTVYRGSTAKITATPTPSTTISWKSENPAIARVNSKGEVTGVKAGNVTITATAHGISRTCAVQVKEPTLNLDKTSMTVYVGCTKQIKATVSPNADVVWKSSNGNVAKVDSKGVVTGVKAGKAVITATANGISSVCTVTVSNPALIVQATSYTMRRGRTVIIDAKTSPSAPIYYYSYHPAIARVDSQGRITAIAPGKTIVRVSANGLKKDISVTVLP